MHAYECYGEMLEDGHLKIPDEVKSQISPNSRVKLVIMIDDNEKESQLNALGKMSGLLSGLRDDELALFDRVIADRVNIKKREGIF
ncbi:MAG TPA: hypothetical protein P5120_16530 [Spirochaetota bacterium]|nr:hypothetical protein [Spirochaetota bacterium]HPF07576.1 hypothetical protein [Spirochaetota bacterium]HPJ44030.1 hypothetical protein [Spirochaetota bacterium]HPR39177.1 hypothetical protein [Spirochaetota bacterium]HRX49128.1 hypothetical protein [Spirochaetota bacterium]